MANFKKDLSDMLNRALQLEHAARIQYLTHAQAIKGIGAEAVISRLKELASDEQKHEEIFRTLIADFLGGEPTMELAKTVKAKQMREILEVNLANEREAIDFYKTIYQKVLENKANFTYTFETLEHQVRHVIIDEQEHVTELSLLLGK